MKNQLKELELNGWGVGRPLAEALAKSYGKGRKIIAPPVIRPDANSLGVIVSWVDCRVLKNGKQFQNMYKSIKVADANTAKEVARSYCLQGSLQE